MSGNLEVNLKLNNWVQRYVILRDSNLYIYESDEKAAKEELFISINEATNVDITSPGGNRFRVKSANSQKKVSFRAVSAEAALEWVLAVRALTYSDPLLTIDDFELLSKIGEGYYGKVRLARKRDTGEFYAIKSIHKRLLLDTNRVQVVFNERNILAACQNPFIVSLYYTFQSQTKFYFCLEFVPGGDLYRHMNKCGPLSLKEARLYVAEIALALAYLHERGVIYRDMTPENVLLDEQGHVKLTDFGLSKDLRNKEVTSTFCGTNEYLAPEVIMNDEYSFPIDWWALGIIFYEMLTGSTPFYSPNRNRMFKNISEADVPNMDCIDPLAASMIVGLLVKNPEKRFGFKEIKMHPLFDDIDWKMVENRQIKPEFVPDSKDPMGLSNFDKNYTSDIPVDSIATPISGSLGKFAGFSFAKMSLTPSEENSVLHDIAPNETE